MGDVTYRYSGHETFHCRPVWLKKGYDLANESIAHFNREEAVIDLGVGKNMVASIKFWLRAFGFYDLQENRLTKIAHVLLGDKGLDPFLEDDATLYLLHYFLIKHVEISSIYHLTFLGFAKEKQQFTVDNLYKYLDRENVKNKSDVTAKTIRNDIKVFLKSYVPVEEQKADIEDSYNGLFYDLRYILKVNSEGEPVYRFNINDGRFMPETVYLYVLLDIFKEAVSISFRDLQEKVSAIFLMDKQGTYSMLERLMKKYPALLIFRDDAGRQELQIRQEIDKIKLLRDYYRRKESYGRV